LKAGSDYCTDISTGDLRVARFHLWLVSGIQRIVLQITVVIFDYWLSLFSLCRVWQWAKCRISKIWQRVTVRFSDKDYTWTSGRSCI